MNKHLNKCYDFKVSTSCMNLLTFHIPPNNALLFMKQIHKLNVNILTLGFLEVVEMEYDEGSE